MKEMNSLTHSCMHSLASLAILAFSGSAVFIIRATGAKLRMLASDARLLCLEPRCGEIDCGKSRDIVRSHWLLNFDHRERRRGENAGADREHDNETSNRACQCLRSDGNSRLPSSCSVGSSRRVNSGSTMHLRQKNRMTNHLQSGAIDLVPSLRIHMPILALELPGRLYPWAPNSLAIAHQSPRPPSARIRT